MGDEHGEVKRMDMVGGQKSLATVKLIERLKTGTPGEMLTDEALTVIAERDTRTGGNGYANLNTAIRYCEREHGIVWSRVAGASCIKCCNPGDIRTLSHKTRRHVRKAAHRSVIQLQAVDPVAMSDTERSEHMVCLAQAGTLAVVADNRTTKKLEARTVTKPLDLTKLLEVWKENE